MDSENLSPKRRALYDLLLAERRKTAAATGAGTSGGDIGLAAKVGQPVLRHQDPEYHPLSLEQRRLWIIDQVEPGNSSYNLPFASRIKGPLNIKALREALNEIVQRHHTLRTVFKVVDGEPVQIVTPDLKFPFTVVDLRDFPPLEQTACAERLVEAAAFRPFNLEECPAARAQLVCLEADEYVLMFTMHHIISDGWSMGILANELKTLYQAFSQGERSPLPPLPLQYKDYAFQQREWLQGEEPKLQLAYWKEQLKDAPAALNLPFDYPRPAVRSSRGAKQWLKFTPKLTKAIEELTRSSGATTFITLSTAFVSFLYRYTGQDDILVGVPVANRNRVELERLIGFFTNTLVLRTRLSERMNFAELMEQVRTVSVQAQAHRDVPFDAIVQALQIESRLTHNPLYQVMINYQDRTTPSFQLHGLQLETIKSISATAQVDLNLHIWPVQNQLVGCLEYSPELCEETTVERMLVHFQTLLEGAVSKPEAVIMELPLMTEAECREIVAGWNNSRSDYEIYPTLHGLIEKQVLLTPEAIAVVHEGELLTYRELGRRADQIAHYLAALGIRSESRVGICMDRSLEMVTALFGTLKSGGVYVPLDPSSPKDRLGMILSDADVSVILTQDHLLKHLPQNAAETVCPDSSWESIVLESCEGPVNESTGDNSAYLIYTSGSTGKPKGVLNAHRGICNRLQWMQHTYGLTADDAVLQKTSLCFDVSVWELFWPLTAGARLVMAPPEAQRDAAWLVRLIADHNITTVHFVPAMLRPFLGEEGLEKCVGLKRVICSGEALPTDLQDKYFSTLSAELHNLYGPTEAAVDVTAWACQRTNSRRSVPIGRPISKTQIYLLDQNYQAVPIGVTGELFIGGVGLARGYVNRADLTAASFVPNPYGPIPGTRLYRTGDSARYLKDGVIDFLGRIDYQAKIRGFRIELGEIEEILRSHSDVREAVVMANERRHGDKYLVAYFVAADPTVSVAELRDYLIDKLPEYMVPSAFIRLDRLPQTVSGKIDRKRLPPVDRIDLEVESDEAPPNTPTEKALVKIWREVLGGDRVGVHEKFFELGGDSILGIQAVAKAKQVGLHFTPQQLFRNQTIAKLAEIVETANPRRIEQGIISGPVGLTPIQRWYFETELIDPHHFNQSLMLEATQKIDPALLDSSIRRLIIHHDSIRLRFVRESSGWRQFYRETDDNVIFSWIDLAETFHDDRSAVVEKAAAELQASLNLETGPLMRVALFTGDEDEPDWILIIIHHLVIDTFSWRVLLEDWQELYRQLSRGDTVRLPPKTSSYKDWAVYLREYSESSAVKDELTYWIDLLGVQSGALPRDFPEGINNEASIGISTVILDRERTQALLSTIPGISRATITDFLLTALMQALVPWIGTNSIVIDLESHGRKEVDENNIDISRTVGWFTSLFPVLLSLNDGHSLTGILSNIREQLHRIPGLGISYGLVRYPPERAEIADKLKHLPRSEVLFNYVGQIDQALPESGMFRLSMQRVGPTRSPRRIRSHLVEINAVITGVRLRIDWAFNRNLFRDATIQQLAESLLNALKRLIDHCRVLGGAGYMPSDFPEAGLSRGELDDIIAEFGGDT